MEWYDYLLYAYFASILAPLFFPDNDPFISLLLTFGVFAIGFMMRPLGAVVIGHIGDIYGRRKALIFSMSIMSFSTFIIGLLPTHQVIGILAPILLTLIRCVQGFAVAGEFGTSASFLVEHANAKQRGFMGSLVMMTAYFGIFIGVAIVTLITYFIPHDVLINGGWRIPFFLALPWGVCALLLRLRAIESPHFFNKKENMAMVKYEKHYPIKTVVFKHPRILLAAVGLISINAVCDYFFIGYFTTFLASANSSLSLEEAMLINMISIFIFLFLVPFFGYVSDKIGRKKVYLASLLSIIIFSLPIFWLLSQKTFMHALSAEILFAILLAGIDGVILTFLAETFPTKIRNTGVTVTYNISLAIFGGTAPFIAFTLVHLTNMNVFPAFYGIFIALISLASLFFFKETYNKRL